MVMPSGSKRDFVIRLLGLATLNKFRLAPDLRDNQALAFLQLRSMDREVAGVTARMATAMPAR
jgi:hypothetical protein